MDKWFSNDRLWFDVDVANVAFNSHSSGTKPSLQISGATLAPSSQSPISGPTLSSTDNKIFSHKIIHSFCQNVRIIDRRRRGCGGTAGPGTWAAEYDELFAGPSL